jgi:hypothetical protein
VESWAACGGKRKRLVAECGVEGGGDDNAECITL